MKKHELVGWAVVLLAALVVLAAGSHLLEVLLGLSADEKQAVAAWVQAIGSVAAIGVAIWVSSLQANEARRQANLARMCFLNSIRAIADLAVSAMGRVAVKWDMHDHFTVESRARQKKWLGEALEAIAAVPLHELHSYHAVMELSRMRKTLEEAMDKLDRQTGPVFINDQRINDFRGWEDDLTRSAAVIFRLTSELAA